MKTSCLIQKLQLASSLQVRWISSNAKYKLMDEIENSIEKEEIKPRKHPGIIKNKIVQLPEWIVNAMRISLEDIDRAQLLKDKLRLSNYLFSRRLPMEEYELKNMYYNIETQVLGKKIIDKTAEEIEDIRKIVKGTVKHKLKQQVFAWKPINFNKGKSLLYTLTRSAPEYAVLSTIFNEIQTRDPDFDPKTVFDFGSGMGSVLWAAMARWNKVNEYLACDISNDMSNICQEIMSHSPKKFDGIFYRQYVPVSNLNHDLVVSAYSLMELPDTKNRLEVVAKLWKKTGKYLVIVEQGTNAGFKIINEARDFINHIMEKCEPEMKYFTFAPCPHDLPCPRYKESQFPCNFMTQYSSSPILGASKPCNELFTYVVLKKDKRTENDNWSRIVRPTLLGSKHARCRLCTTAGKLEEVVFTASKYGRPLYRCAKATRWGDRLPIEPTAIVSNENQESDLNSEILGDTESNSSSDEETNIEQKPKEKIFISDIPFSQIKNDR